MSEGLTNQEQQVLIFVLRENIASLEAEMKSRERAYQNTDTGWRNMNIADAARIEKIEAELLTHQWVSVEDGLPEVGEWYVAYSPESQIVIACYNFNDQPFKKYYTHWKPITLPPEKEGE